MSISRPRRAAKHLVTGLTPEGWRRIKPILDRVLEVPEVHRDIWLREHCRDELLRRRIRLLLQSTHESDALETPLVRLLDPEPEALLVGQEIGPYQVTRSLGRGGVGTVYLARCQEDGEVSGNSLPRWVAIKVLRRGMDTDDILRRFEQEREILSRLNHPGIARLFDAGALPDGRPYLVMEVVEGKPIDSYCEQQTLDFVARLRLFRQACAAVHAAHQLGIVHRDLKPSHLVVTQDGIVKLLDFGIAKWLDPERPDLTRGRTGMAPMMTPAYASPEQWLEQKVGPASDVYALGAVLWKLLLGQELHRQPEKRHQSVLRGGEEVPPVARLLRHQTRWRLSRTQRHRLEGIFRKALAFDPALRLASVAALDADLASLLRQRLRTGARQPESGTKRSGGRFQMTSSSLMRATLPLAFSFAIGAWLMQACGHAFRK